MGNDALGLSSEAVTNETPDTIAPTVSTVEITSDPGSDRIYAPEDEIQATVTFSEPVDVERTPRLMLKVGERNRPAGYVDGTGTTELVFGYEVVKGDEDTDGVSIDADSLSLNGGMIEDASDNSAVLDHDGLAADSGHKVDGAGPDLAETDRSGGRRNDADADLRRAARQRFGAAGERVQGDGGQLVPNSHRRCFEREHGAPDPRPGGGARRDGDPGELHGADRNGREPAAGRAGQ